ncbi:glycosyltransferase [Bifidobacterium aquikefiricola]|uniref:Glycosyltransferase n=1 Tax=Bifidobacterium aquikefiricola TaxID=3059038 RepID=A0AB39U515_9BIFI
MSSNTGKQQRNVEDAHKPMRVLFVLQDLHLGGIQRVNSTIASALNSTEYDVSLLLTRPNDAVYSSTCHTYTTRRDVKNFIFDGSRHVLRKIPFLSINNVSINRLYQFLRKHSFDVIILNPGFFSAAARIKQLYPRTRTLLWMHNNFDIYMDKYFADSQKELGAAAREADGIICLERYTLSKWKAFNKNCYLIHNPTTIESDGKVADLNSKKIAFAGRLVIQQKGLDYLLQIAELIPDDWYISVAGSGQDEEQINAMAKERNLLAKLQFKGPLYGTDLLNHYLSSSILVMPSRWEGFSLVAVEAMSCGLPIVAFDIPAMREATDNGHFSLLADYGNVASFASELNSLIQSFEKRQRYSSLSLRRSKDFSINSVVSTWQQMLADINSRAFR